MLSKKLISYLRDSDVRFDIIKHHPSYTALTTAESAHVSGKMMAKTVMLVVDGEMQMFVLPASQLIDMEALREIFGTYDIRLATENEFVGKFTDCEVGGMPPFGNLYGMPVYVSARLTKDEEIAFNAGDHSKLVMMSYRDYDKLVHPHVINYGM